MLQSLKNALIDRQALFVRELEQWLDASAPGRERIPCRKGCRHCCTMAVHASLPEALLVADALDEGQEGALERHIERLREELDPKADFKTYLKLHRSAIGPCPFLDAQGECGIYPVRPFACRSLFSTRPAAWCAADMGALHPLEKQAFLSSLDRDLVAYPTHYAAAPQERGRELEGETLWEMRELCGRTLSGNLTVLVYLERRHRLSERLREGREAVAGLFSRAGLPHPVLHTLAP